MLVRFALAMLGFVLYIILLGVAGKVFIPILLGGVPHAIGLIICAFVGFLLGVIYMAPAMMWVLND
jgi:hypothetical protein